MSLRVVSVKINDINSAKVRNISYDSNINVKVDSQEDYTVNSVNHKAVSVKVNEINSTKVRNISYDSNINVKVDSQQDYVVKSVNQGAKRIRNLEDVSALNPQDDDVLIYNAISGVYESKQITLDEIDFDSIDAGTF